ncbi:MAG: hypothetical protein AAGC55_22190, partial [Myxococcota bacterium]
ALAGTGQTSDHYDDAAESNLSGYFRVDQDYLDTFVWVGASEKLNSWLTWEHYLKYALPGDAGSHYVQYGVGLGIQRGSSKLAATLAITPNFVAGTREDMLLTPGLWWSLDLALVTVEGNCLVDLSRVFNDSGEDDYQCSLVVARQLSSLLRIGAQVEFEGPLDDLADEVRHIPVGGNALIAVGKDRYLSLFGGYNLVGEEGISGRVSFIHNW